MAAIQSAIKAIAQRLMEHLSREGVRRELLARSDHFLADIGLSRDLLEEGVSAWPWRAPELRQGGATPAARAAVASAPAMQPAQGELRAA